MESVRGIQYYLAILGHNLCITKRISLRILLWTVLAFNLFLITFSAVFEFLLTFETTWIQTGILRFQIVLATTYYFSLLRKSAQIENLVQTLGNHLNPTDIKRSYALSFLVMASFTIGCFINILAHRVNVAYAEAIRDFFDLPDINLIKSILVTLKTIAMMQLWNWTVPSDIIFLNLFYVLVRAKIRLLKSIDTFRPSQSIPLITGHIIDIHSSFELTMSLYPFLTISYLFCTVSQTVYFMKSSNGVSTGTWSLITTVLKIVSALSLVLCTSYLNNKLIDMVRDIEKRIHSDERLESVEKSILVHLLEKSVQQQKITGWGLFQIDLPLILSFLCSLVTFTILFLTELK